MTAMTICGGQASPDGRRTDSGRTDGGTADCGRSEDGTADCGRGEGSRADGGTAGGGTAGGGQAAHSDNYATSDPQTAQPAGITEAAAHSLPDPRSGLLSRIARIAAAHWTTWTTWTIWTSWFGLPGWIGGVHLAQFFNGPARFPGCPEPGLSFAQPYSGFSGFSDVSHLTDASHPTGAPDPTDVSDFSGFSDDADAPLPEPFIHTGRPDTPAPTSSAPLLTTSSATFLPAASTSTISGAPTASVALLLLPTATSHPSMVGRLITALARVLLTMHAWDKTTKLLAGSAIGLIPWIVILGLTLPSHTVASNWSTVWIGFDVLLAVAFGVTARLYLRNDPRVGIMAAVVATLLVVDGWFDTSTAANGFDVIESWASAIFVEIPIAIFCARLAWRSSLAMVRVPQPDSTEPSE
jgi:hypothetical protein